MDGVCLDDNPCADVTCAHGCVRGRCLQNRHARGPDADGDGYTRLADCDDDNAFAHPGRAEICGNATDDNCDGFIDEMPCLDPSEIDGGPGGGPGGGGPGGSGEDEGGCGCGVRSADDTSTAALVLLAIAALFRRRRHR
jgi:MYXO-CTERM domain-containing protein